MTRFGMRTWRYLAMIWVGAIALELVVWELAQRTNNSWVLLLGVALLVLPIIATERTFQWLGRAPRKRWKRHDVEAAIAQGLPAPVTEPAASVEPAGGWRPGGDGRTRRP
jgi:membrane protein YdbS with pleckstrin-like domain